MTDVLTAHHVLDYPGGYTRSVGPVVGRFLTGLRDGRIEGVRLADGRVLVPPTEYDPTTSAEIAPAGDHWLTLGPAGRVQSFTWVAEPRADKHPLTKPFAFALIRPDGADTAMLHVVDCGSADGIVVGSRVAPAGAPSAPATSPTSKRGCRSPTARSRRSRRCASPRKTSSWSPASCR